MTSNKYTDKEINLIRKLYQDENKTAKEIVVALKKELNSDRSERSIRRAIRNNNLMKQKQAADLTKEEELEILKLYKEGKNCQEIGDILGYTNKRINAFLRRNNLSSSLSIYNKVTKEEIDDMCKMYKDGYPAAEIIKKYNDKIVCENTIIKLIKENGTNIRARGTFPNIKHEDFFEKIDTEEKAYILGWLISDGYVINPKGKRSPFWGIALKTSDKYILEWIRETIGVEKKIVDSVRDKKEWKTGLTYRSELTIVSSKMVKDLEKYTITERKTYTVKIPDNIPEELLPHLIRGVFDGDGCISNKSVSFYGNEFVTKDIQKILEEKISLNKVTCKFIETCFRFTFSSKQNVKDFYHYIYDDATIYLKRKKERFEKLDYVN